MKNTVDLRAEKKKERQLSTSERSDMNLDLEESIQIDDNYQPKKLIGKGAFGEVVLVYKKELEQYFAMKIIRKTAFTMK